MKKSQYGEGMIIRILQEAESGVPVRALCRRHGMCDATFYNWRRKYGGMNASGARRLKSSEEENHRLKKLLADTKLDKEALRSALSKEW